LRFCRLSRLYHKLYFKEQKAKVPKVQSAIKRIAILIAVTSISLIIIACNRGKDGGDANDSSAATVNGKDIKLSKVNKLLNQQAGGQESQLSPIQLATARMQILDSLIQQEVLYQRAEKEKLLPTEDQISQELTSQKQQNRMTEEEYQKRLQDMGQTEADLRDEIKRTLAIRNLQEKVNGKISISNQEVEAFYNENKASFVSARGVSLSAIMTDPNDNGLTDDAKSDLEAKAKIDLISQRLKSADFATVARAQSEDPNSNIYGGDIGFIPEEKLKQMGAPPDLVSSLFGSMQVGDITSPININNRWYIFKLTNRQLQNENLTLESPGVRDQIKETLINQRRAILNSALLTVAMNESKITNHLAQKMLESPENLSGARPANAGNQSGNQSASPAANPTASPASSPAAATSPTTATPNTGVATTASPAAK
jgi:parvulin-like peptidyl-prolyl isomerase